MGEDYLCLTLWVSGDHEAGNENGILAIGQLKHARVGSYSFR